GGAGVIRRKAGEIEERAKALAEQEAIAQAVAAQNREAAEEEKPTGSDEAASSTGEAGETQAALAGTATPEEPKRVRGNIIGPMDLRRVVTPGGAGQGGFGPRYPRSTTAPRGIRPGFVAPIPVMDMPRVESDQERQQREEKEKKKRATSREEE